MGYNSVDSFLEKLQSVSPASRKKTFEKKRTIDKVFLNYKGNFGKYQILPLNSVVSEFPFVSLLGTREINIPRKNMASDGTESVYNAWIRILPKNGYTMKDPSSGREVSSLTAAEEALLDQAYAVWEELYSELDARNQAMDPNIGGLIRRKNYTIFHGYCANMWAEGDTRKPARQNFSGLFVVTAKGFLDLVNSSILDTNITSGMGNNNWVADLYNRDLTNRKGFMMLSINKADGPGFNISVNHQLGAEQYLAGVSIPEDDAALMQNPVETFLGWQANREEDVQADQRRLFNKTLITEAIEYMTDLLAKTRMAKQNGSSVEDAIAATNQTVLASQSHTTSHGQATNDPILAQMAEQAKADTQTAGYGNSNVANNPEEVAAKNTNPFQNPAASHIDPITGAPVGSGGFGGFGGGEQTSGSAPFSAPSFAGGFGSGNGDLPF